MTDKTNKSVSSPFTHTAYLFIRIGMTKHGKVYGYWKNGGKFRFKQEVAGPFPFIGPSAFIDLIPRGGWDGRIRFVKFGDPPPEPREPDNPEEFDSELS